MGLGYVRKSELIWGISGMEMNEMNAPVSPLSSRRKPRPQLAASADRGNWVPAFAGMTSVGGVFAAWANP